MSLIEHIPTPADHAARRARMGAPIAKRPISMWHYQRLAEQEAAREKALQAILAKYRCAVDTSGPLFTAKPIRVWTPFLRARRAVRLVAYIWGVTVEDIMGSRRSAVLVSARHAAIYVVAKITEWSLPELGKRFGGRDHTTILHALKKIGASKPRRAYQSRAIAAKAVAT